MRYTSDLTDAQWEQIKEYFPAGNKSKYDKREPIKRSIVFGENRMPMEKFAKGFSKLESSVNVLLSCTEKRSMG